VIDQLAAVQPQWPVSTPALAAAIACSNKHALDESAQAALDGDRQRAYLLEGLACTTDAGVGRVATYGVARAPFVLVRVDGAAEIREALRERGFAVRRGDTFPGLGTDWLRIAVRPEAVTDGFLKVWRDVLG
jgi:histidinol-phosphate aminotransferase